MSDPSLAAFDAAVVEHLLVARARSRMLEDVRANRPWNVDLGTGELTLGGDRHSAQILGTFARESQTFLWAWGNPGAAEWGPSLGLVNALRILAESTPGLACFGERIVPAARVNPNELGLVAAELSGRHPLFVGGYDGGAAFLMVTSLKLRFEELPIAYLPGIFVDLPTISTTAPPRACIRRFLERSGFALSESAAVVGGQRSDGDVVVRFDELGRIAKVDLTARAR